MTKPTNNPPIETHRDGAVSAKVWRNITKDGKPAYSVTFQRTYTDPNTQQIAESRSFHGTDILKVPQLAGEAYRTIGKMRELDKENRAQQQDAPQRNVDQPQHLDNQPQQGLSQQRDAAMQNAGPAQNVTPDQAPSPER